MSSVQEIADAVRHLSDDQRMQFRAWFAEFDAAEWDKKIETDVASGKLNWLIKEAREDSRAGRTSDR